MAEDMWLKRQLPQLVTHKASLIVTCLIVVCSSSIVLLYLLLWSKMTGFDDI